MPNLIKYFLLLLLPVLNYGQQIKVLSIYYPSNVYQLNIEQKHSIDSFLTAHAFESIELIGHADTVGNLKANLKISSQRAKQIETYIHSQISTATIKTLAHGEKQKNNFQSDLTKQRRVDIILQLTTIETIEISQEEIVEVNPKNDITKLVVPKISRKQKFKDDLLSQDKIVVENLLFEPGKTTFLYDKIPNELFYLADLMDSIQSMEIKIEGHVCCVDDKKLSTDRAKSVYLFLRAVGIDKRRMEYEGFSNERPLVEEKTAEDQQKNRRVEILVTRR